MIRQLVSLRRLVPSRIILPVILLGSQTFTQEHFWERTAFSYLGGNTTSCGVNIDGTIYASLRKGARTYLFSSTDRGSSWNLSFSSPYNIYMILFNSRGHVFLTGDKIFRSSDNGGLWNEIGQDVPVVSGNVMTISPDDVLILGTNSGLYRSTNGGEGWTKLSTRLADRFYWSPSRILYAAAGNLIWSPDSGVTWGSVSAVDDNLNGLVGHNNGTMFAFGSSAKNFVSIDSGKTWRSVRTQRFVLALGIDSESRIIAANSSGDSVLISSDLGETWISSPNKSIRYSRGSTFAIDHENNMFAVSDGVYLSTNGGTEWVKIGLPNDHASSLQPLRSGSLIVNGRFLSGDLGNSWRTLSTPVPFHSFDADTSSNLLAGSDSSWIYVSNDSGNTWSRLGNQIPTPNLYPGNVGGLKVSIMGDYFAVVGYFGPANSYRTALYRSTNQGSNWEYMLEGAFLSSIAIDRTGTTVVVAGGESYISTNRGTTWRLMADIPQRTSTNFPLKVLLDVNKNVLIGDGNQNLWISTDAGYNWNLRAGNVSTFCANSDIFVLNNIGISRSSDLGSSWASINHGLDSTVITTLAVDDDGFLFAGTTEGLFRSHSSTLMFIRTSSTDFEQVAFGDSLSRAITFYNPSISSVRITSISSSSSAFRFKGILPIEINGTDSLSLIFWFQPISFGPAAGLITIEHTLGTAQLGVTGNSPYPSISLSPTNIVFGTVKKDSTAEKIISITNTSINSLHVDSLYTSSPYFDVLRILPNKVIQKSDTANVSIRFKPDSARTFLDTLYLVNNSNISPFKVPLSGNGTTTSAIEDIANIPREYALFQNYPNPFNPLTKIRFAVPMRSKVILSVYNLLGQHLALLTKEELNAGFFERIWYANVPSGIYFYRIDAVSVEDPPKRFVDAKKMLILR